ncbi:capsular glucan synthase [bacterium BMS3Bbin04]|nr:capsular glucan synthase [bacterium BMS3Bbin04]
MKITFVIYGDLNTLSGGYVYDRYLLRHLKKCGDQIRVVSLWDGSYLRHMADNFSRELPQNLLVGNPDLILQDEICHPSLVLANHRIKQMGAPPVVSLVHHLLADEGHPLLTRNFYKTNELLYFSGIDGVLANTHVTLNRVREVSHRQLPAAVAWPGSTLPSPPLSRTVLNDRLNEQRPLQILFVGNLVERKMVTVLLTSIIKLLRHTDARLKIVGGGKLEPKYARRVKRIAKPLIDKGIVSFTGPKRGKELAELYSESDVLVVPSSYEGFGIVYLEGMAYGLPAIGSAAGGAREIIEDGVNGYLVHPSDSNTLTQYLLQLARDRGLLARMSRAARDRFERHPSWTQSMDNAREFLLRMAKK